MILDQENINVPVFDTTRIHSKAAVAYALLRVIGERDDQYTFFSQHPELKLGFANS